MDISSHSQADITYHQLDDQVYCGRYNINQIRIPGEKWNECHKGIKNIYQTLEGEENGMQNKGAFVYGDVGVVLLQF
jgi:hypothetical protein